jgi:hypothetical protein
MIAGCDSKKEVIALSQSPMMPMMSMPILLFFLSFPPVRQSVVHHNNMPYVEVDDLFVSQKKTPLVTGLMTQFGSFPTWLSRNRANKAVDIDTITQNRHHRQTTTITMVLSILTTLVFLISAGSTQAAFVPTENVAFSRNVRGVRQSALQPLNMMDASDVFASANSLLLSTIDSDIAAIPDNEFTTIFAGGIVSHICWRLLQYS